MALTLFFYNRQKREALAINSYSVKISTLKIHFSSYCKLLIICFTLSGAGVAGVVSSCSSPKTFAFSCQERQIEIYVDDEYLGRDLVYYTVPKDRKYIEISCRDNGVEVYHRRINVDGRKGSLIELQIPKNYRYSNKPY